MKKIGGFFTHETCMDTENGFFRKITPEDGDFRLMMSGRCANYYALCDICQTDDRRVAYVPVYTCETVLAPFEKAGFSFCFYQIDPDGLTPRFDPAVLDKISVISICGYYGFSNYDQDFLRQCKEKGIKIIEDTTHSILSDDGICPYCDYVVGSLRKWLGVPAGGFAIKTEGKFTLPVLAPDMVHLGMRSDSMKEKLRLQDSDKEEDIALLEKATDQFWAAEMMLRKIFASYESDADSSYIMLHADLDSISDLRKKNYTALADNFPLHPLLKPVFPQLTSGVVPSHFSVYAEERAAVQDYLKAHGISTTVYWPKSEYSEGFTDAGSDYIYDHVLSLPCDQRYTAEDMLYICEIIANMPASF